jgi:hypothetical protein
MKNYIIEFNIKFNVGRFEGKTIDIDLQLSDFEKKGLAQYLFESKYVPDTNLGNFDIVTRKLIGNAFGVL